MFKEPDFFSQEIYRTLLNDRVSCTVLTKEMCFFANEPPPPPYTPTPPLPRGKRRSGNGCVHYRQGRWSVFQWKCYVWHAAEAPAAAVATPASTGRLRNRCAHAKSTATICVINRFPAATRPSGSRLNAPPAFFENLCQARFSYAHPHPPSNVC